MEGKELSSVPLQKVGNGLTIQDADPLRFRVGSGSDRKTREFAAFIGDHRFFGTHQAPEFRQGFYPERPITGSQPEIAVSDGDNDDGDDDEEENEDGDMDDNDDSHEVKGDDGNENIRDNTNNCLGSLPEARAVTIAEPECAVYYSQYLQATEGGGSVSAHKDVVVSENGCGVSGGKDASSTSNSTDSLRAILSDPLTGALMDDAMILPCGHSFGAGGIEQVKQMKACYTCSQPVSIDSITPNLALRVAVQAFRREEILQMNRPSKRRKEGSDYEKRSFSDSADHPRCRNVQFPFSVADRVVIKGNKRTPPRFVGREAVVTSQCLNGWYVVKTLDNAESVKLQYRSLAKAPEDSSLKATPSKMVANWL